MVIKNTAVKVYLSTSIHIAIAVGCLALITFMQNHIPLNQAYIGLLFTGSLIVYNGLKYGKIWWSKIPISSQLRFILGLTLLAIPLFLKFFFLIPFAIQKSLVKGFGLVILYPWVRKLGWLKLFWVSGTITYFTVIIPLLTCKQSMEIMVLEGFSRFIILTALMIPFEIYDSIYDPPQLGTLPQRFGILRVKQFGYFLVVLFVGIKCCNNVVKVSLTSVSIALLSIAAIYKTQPYQSKVFTAFWVEALPMVWAGLVFVFEG